MAAPPCCAALCCPNSWKASRPGGWSDEAKLVEHQRFAAWLRAQIQPTFDTSVLSVEEVADRIAGWVHGLLVGAAPGGTAIAAPPED